MEPILEGLTFLIMFLGLNRRVGLLWITGAFFGMAYGTAIIVGEAEKGYLTKGESERLHASIGNQHSIIEHPALFMTLGLGPFWLWVPRLIAAVLVIHLLRLWEGCSLRFIHRGS